MKVASKDFEICRFDFSKEGLDEVSVMNLGCNWPVVYMINNDSEIYIGETSCARKRFEQHQQNEERQRLTEIRIIFDESYNKSATQDIEQSLIRLFDADHKYSLQNRNAGFSADHNYYQREIYAGKVREIWKELHHIGLTNSSYIDLSNSDLFKYSPYITLTAEQRAVCFEALNDCLGCLENGTKGKALINGCAGTGKTIVAIHMIHILLEAMNHREDVSREPSPDMTYEEEVLHRLHLYIKEHGNLRIGFVIPVKSACKSMKVVFKSMRNGMKACPVMGSSAVANSSEPFDVLFVDESHRTRICQNVPNISFFRNTNRKMGLDPDGGSELDWILMKSRYAVLFYDKEQAVRNSDIPYELFEKLTDGAKKFELESQMRCSGGKKYVDYVADILACKQTERLEMDNYEFVMYDDVSDMVLRIKELDAIYGLCRNVAGYSWKWVTHNMSHEEAMKSGLADIVIGDARFIWNTTNDNWVIRETSVDEIGSIHTVQGFDLNYVGVIFGKEIDYDPENDCIVIDRKEFQDRNSKANASDEDVKRYILNAYRVMMTRGIMGCFIYVCNDNLREYLRRFVPSDTDLPDVDRF